ncbi:MAG: methyltransferase domain-containing protein, partial [Verrucomicrobiota bacterium]|nr:methyltransferase domain-containing protein [Verrucomicrobiota bacterium]
MILHRLIGHHLKYGDDAAFYRMQAEDAITWMETCGRVLAPSLRTLDLGCGHGVFGKSLMQKGCQVTFADVDCQLEPELRSQPFLSVDLDKDDYRSLGTYPFIVCSNVFEHLAS